MRTIGRRWRTVSRLVSWSALMSPVKTAQCTLTGTPLLLQWSRLTKANILSCNLYQLVYTSLSNHPCLSNCICVSMCHWTVVPCFSPCSFPMPRCNVQTVYVLQWWHWVGLRILVPGVVQLWACWPGSLHVHQYRRNLQRTRWNWRHLERSSEVAHVQGRTFWRKDKLFLFVSLFLDFDYWNKIKRSGTFVRDSFIMTQITKCPLFVV